MGHDFAGEGYVSYLVDGARVHQEDDVGLRLAGAFSEDFVAQNFFSAGQRQGFGGFADVGNVLLVADRFFGEFQNSFEDDSV